jgi:hypothetical protein
MDKLGGGEKVPPEMDPEKLALSGTLPEVSTPSIDDTDVKE